MIAGNGARRWAGRGKRAGALAGLVLLAGSVSPVFAAVPPVPANVSARATSYDQAEITWQVSFGHLNAGAWGFEVYRRGGGADWMLVDSTSVNRASSVDYGLQPETRYEYAVCAINQDGPNCSPSAFATTPTAIVTPRPA